ncbi:MAG TPA: hypothetical protein DC017_16420 [Candidatus Wallbacteria bacterium]|nr:hypothetical protein [Candidatus Wallbacteria bacterium]
MLMLIALLKHDGPAASRLRIQIDSMPYEIDVIERRIIQLEIEREALKKEGDDKDALARLADIEKELM